MIRQERKDGDRRSRAASRERQSARQVARLNSHTTRSGIGRAQVDRLPAISRARAGDRVYLRWSAIPACDRVMMGGRRMAAGRIVGEAVRGASDGVYVQVSWDGDAPEWVMCSHLARVPEAEL